MDRSAWQTTVHGVTELDATEQVSTQTQVQVRKKTLFVCLFVCLEINLKAMLGAHATTSFLTHMKRQRIQSHLFYKWSFH